jgi:hypothetical protein
MSAAGHRILSREECPQHSLGGRGKFVIDVQAPPAPVAVKSEKAGAEMLKGTEVGKR